MESQPKWTYWHCNDRAGVSSVLTEHEDLSWRRRRSFWIWRDKTASIRLEHSDGIQHRMSKNISSVLWQYNTHPCSPQHGVHPWSGCCPQRCDRHCVCLRRPPQSPTNKDKQSHALIETGDKTNNQTTQTGCLQTYLKVLYATCWHLF